MFYCGNILETIFPDPHLANSLAIGVQGMQLVVTLASSLFMDRAGRKPLLILGLNPKLNHHRTLLILGLNPKLNHHRPWFILGPSLNPNLPQNPSPEASRHRFWRLVMSRTASGALSCHLSRLSLATSLPASLLLLLTLAEELLLEELLLPSPPSAFSPLCLLPRLSPPSQTQNPRPKTQNRKRFLGISGARLSGVGRVWGYIMYIHILCMYTCINTPIRLYGTHMYMYHT
jgi:MFS family permease